MTFEEAIYSIFAGPLVSGMKMLSTDTNSPFTDGTCSGTKVVNPFDKHIFECRRKKLLHGVSLSGRLVDVEKACAKSAIDNIKVPSCLSNINLDAIALFVNKAAAALLE